MEITYDDFIKSKIKRITDSGFDVNESDINPLCFDFQKYIIRRAIKQGRFAIFADCGLGKTLMQLEWARLVSNHTDKPVLILAPLAVSGQTIHEGAKFGIEVFKHPHCHVSGRGIFITNYEQIDNVNADDFSGIVLDESSILKNYEGSIKNQVLSMFGRHDYRLACTATPSPNDPMELGNHSEFLGYMTRLEMLSMFFVHDGGETQKWRLKGHAENDFWKFVSQWSVMLSNPADLGFDGTDYVLPSLNYIEKQIETESRGGSLFNDVAISATNFNQELRITKVERLSEVSEIVNNSKESFIIWIKQNEEGELIKKLIPDAVEVKGSDDPEIKESRLLGFAEGQFRVLVTKTKIGQFGLNYQNCHNQIFASLDFSFEGLYQAIRRSYRFGQSKPVNIYLITTDTMQNVLKTIQEKQRKFETMQKSMTEHLNTEYAQMMKEKEYLPDQIGENHAIKHGDCVKRMAEIDNDSIHFSIFSPPFAEMYVYSDDPADMGNVKNYEEFFIGFKFMLSELNRVMMHGRNVAIHCMDLPIQKGKEGFIGLRDFSGMIIDEMINAGFIYHTRVTLWKDPVIEMQRTKALGLLHKQLTKDSTKSRVGIPDYLLVFKKDGDNPVPVQQNIPVDIWQKWASPVWMDIDYGNTLQRESAREENDEKHIAPLQLDTIERAIALWTNPGEIVFSPYGGIGSEGYQALKMKRKSLSIELKRSYFEQNCLNLKSIEEMNKQVGMFE